MRTIIFLLTSAILLPNTAAFVGTGRNINIRTPSSRLFSSLTHPDDWVFRPTKEDEAEYEDMLTKRIEKEGKEDGSVMLVSTVAAALLSMTLMMAAFGGTNDLAISSSAPATATEQESLPKQERIYRSPEVQEEESFDFLIDQSAGFFF